jgi:hypothetical protein
MVEKDVKTGGGPHSRLSLGAAGHGNERATSALLFADFG